MGDVVNFDRSDLVSCSYYDLGGDFGVTMRDRSMQIVRLNKDEFEFGAFGESQVFKRAELAEFLQVATIFIDSENKYLPNADLIGSNYD